MTSDPNSYVFIHTIGCQMNVYDADQIEAGLNTMGFSRTWNLEQADAVILNTCTIREKAEQKAVSFIGRLVKLKRNKPHLIVGVGGCLAQQQGRALLKRFPHVDIVFGTRAIDRLPRLVQDVRHSGTRLADVDMNGAILHPGPFPNRYDTLQVSRFVTIMRGCDNFCSYCVVPFVRGRETSRPVDDIAEEIRQMAAAGTREVTLLGQNVNSYGLKEGFGSFTDLLRRIHQTDHLTRIRFTTSHPKDLSDELIDAFGRMEKLCRHIHLPVQSGADRILERMNRKYTRNAYIEKINRLRRRYPDIAVTTDIIVGFPGETRRDFEDTMDLLCEVDYDNIFAFAYSDRPQAPARRFGEKVPELEKNARLNEILDFQKRISMSMNRKWVGRTTDVLVEGAERKPRPDDRRPPVWYGRNSQNKIVNFETDDRDGVNLTGQTVCVLIREALPHSLRGASGIQALPEDSPVKEIIHVA